MGDVGANILQLRSNGFSRLKEVNWHKLNARINPGIGKGASRGDDDFAPALVSKLDSKIFKSSERGSVPFLLWLPYKMLDD